MRDVLLVAVGHIPAEAAAIVGRGRGYYLVRT
jgi:hypothetical protein